MKCVVFVVKKNDWFGFDFIVLIMVFVIFLFCWWSNVFINLLIIFLFKFLVCIFVLKCLNKVLMLFVRYILVNLVFGFLFLLLFFFIEVSEFFRNLIWFLRLSVFIFESWFVGFLSLLIFMFVDWVMLISFKLRILVVGFFIWVLRFGNMSD